MTVSLEVADNPDLSDEFFPFARNDRAQQEARRRPTGMV
jgi:hypothetical protein